MPRRPRSSAATGFYHVVNRSVRKEPLFTQPHEYTRFLSVLGEGIARYNVPLVAYCVMNNHWHLLVGPLGKPRLSRVIQWVTSTHAMVWHRSRGTVGQGHVYQGRFTSTPLDDIGSLVPMSRYVERNAKSAGLVVRAEDWPWSSLFDRVRGHQRVPMSGGAFLASGAWIDYVNATITRRELIRESHMRQQRQRALPGRRSSVPKTAKTVEKGSDPAPDPGADPDPDASGG